MELSHRLVDEVVLSVGSMDFQNSLLYCFSLVHILSGLWEITVRFIPKSVMGIFKPWPLSIMCKYFGHRICRWIKYCSQFLEYFFFVLSLWSLSSNTD
jgi:hypothetical protein